MKIAVVNTKGGVAKTTSAVHLASILATRGPTLFVDADPHGSAVAWLERADADIDHVAFTSPGMAKALQTVAEDYEHVVIDTPPNDVTMTQEALIAADVVVIPTGPSMGDMDRLSTTRDIVESVQTIKSLPMTVVFTRVDRRARDAEVARAALERLGFPVAATEIPLRAEISRGFGVEVNAVTSPYWGLCNELEEMVAATAGEKG